MLELRLRSRTLRFERTLVMGVLNVTPDSFSDGGRYADAHRAVARALEMAAQGADVIDIGGESTRPGAEPVSADEERRRVVPVIEQLGGALGQRRSAVALSIDTSKPEVAAEALAAGAEIVNDVRGLEPPMLEVAADGRAAAIAMHMQGDPRTMQARPEYADVVGEVATFLAARLQAGRDHGVPVMLDPGIGFGKTVEHNVELLANLGTIVALGAPVLVGASRKSFLGKITGAELEERLAPTIACHTAAVLAGAHMVRAHDVREAVLAARTADALRAARSGRPGRVEVRGLHALARVGVGAEERRLPQVVRVDLEVSAPLERAAATDDISATVDYVRIAEVTRASLLEEPAALLEHLAARVGDRVLRELPNVASITVRLAKPLVAEQLDAESVAVELERRR